MGKSNKIDPQEALRLAARRLFSTADGQEVLNALKARTIQRPNFPALGADGHAMALMMAMREGENNLYRYLTSLLIQQQEQQTYDDSRKNRTTTTAL